MAVSSLLAGVVVLFNPDEGVKNNILSYAGCLEKLYVVDNSEKQNTTLTDFLTSIKNVFYIKPGLNLGIASALNIGANRAIQDGFKFLLTMDQDSAASGDMISLMKEEIFSNRLIGLISPFHVNRFNTKAPSEGDFSEELVVMASGNIINLKAFKQVGGFNENYFIDYVDTEFCLKLWANGFKVIRANKANLIHNEANLTRKKIFNHYIYPSNHSPVRFYYKARNRNYIRKVFRKKYPEYFKLEANVFRNTLFKALLFENKKALKLWMVIRGYYDYFRGKTGIIGGFN